MSIIFVNSIVKANSYFQPDYMTSNSGNIIWHEGCKKEIKYDYEISLTDVPKRNFTKSDILVVPVANNFQSYDSIFSDKLKILQLVPAKVVLIGLGIQSDLIRDFDCDLYIKSLSKEKILFYQYLSKKSVSIGVRGEYTARCLEKIGISNIRVIGCPSFYSNLLEDNSNEIVPVDNNKVQGILFNMTNVTNERSIIRIIRRYDDNSYYRFTQISQQVEDEKIFRGGVQKWNAVNLKEIIEGNINIAYDYSFCFGTRFHGNMFAYLNGIPSLWVVHDARTYEMCEAMKLPYLLLENIQNRTSFSYLLSQTKYDEAFYKHRKKMRRNYIEFLHENEISNYFA